MTYSRNEGSNDGRNPPRQSDLFPFGLLSSGLVGLWMVVGLRLISLESHFGPLVLMAQWMVLDLMRWGLLVIVMLIAFTAALHAGVGMYENIQGVRALMAA